MFLFLRWTQTVLMGMVVLLLMDSRGIAPAAGVGWALASLLYVWLVGAVMGVWWSARPKD